MTVIYLIRHGEIPTYSPRRFIGRTDPPLTERGRQQIAKLGEMLKSCAVDRLVCSPLLRCRESAQLLGPYISQYIGCEPEVVQDLAEISLGAWEGLTVEEVRQRFPGSYEARGLDLAGFRPPGGESFADLQKRAWSALANLVAAGPRRLAVVAHAGVNRVLLCQLLGMPLTNLFRLEQGYGCLNVVHATADGYRVECINIRPEQPG